MSDQFGLFWNSINADRTYDADSFAEWLRKFFTTGVFNGEMQVTPGAGMAVSVAPGYANLNGKVRFFDAAQSFALDPASGTYPRIDTIVVRSDSTNRVITTEYVKGAYSGNNPVPTAPVRTAGIYEIVLAQIYVGAGITAVIADDITDTRPDDDLCGWVTSTVESVPVDQIVTQMQAQFLTWFDEMKGQLSEDAAGHLQLEIDDLSDTTSSAITTLGNRVEGIRSGVATIEFSPTISAHTAGDYFFATSSQGHIDLFKALVDIPAGATLVEGTNIDFAVLADDLKNGLTQKLDASKFNFINVMSMELTSTGTTGTGTTQYLIYKFSDGTRRQYGFSPTGISCQYFDGSTWTTLWNK